MPGVDADTARPGPYLVAHRAGNDPARLAAPPGVVVEADLHLHGGSVEVRHLKSAWPLPVLYDGRRLVGAWRPRLQLATLLRELPAGTPLMLDLKGPWPRLARLVREAIALDAHERPTTVCARWWPLLDHFDDLPVRRVHSVGGERQLRLLLRRAGGRRLDAIVLPESLLDRATMRVLETVAGEVLTWPVNEPGRARELIGLGVRGLISDRPELILPCLAGAPPLGSVST